MKAEKQNIKLCECRLLAPCLVLVSWLLVLSFKMSTCSILLRRRAAVVQASATSKKMNVAVMYYRYAVSVTNDCMNLFVDVRTDILNNVHVSLRRKRNYLKKRFVRTIPWMSCTRSRLFQKRLIVSMPPHLINKSPVLNKVGPTKRPHHRPSATPYPVQSLVGVRTLGNERKQMRKTVFI